jgi:hypothetical protein
MPSRSLPSQDLFPAEFPLANRDRFECPQRPVRVRTVGSELCALIPTLDPSVEEGELSFAIPEPGCAAGYTSNSANTVSVSLSGSNTPAWASSKILTATSSMTGVDDLSGLWARWQAVPDHLPRHLTLSHDRLPPPGRTWAISTATPSASSTGSQRLLGRATRRRRLVWSTVGTALVPREKKAVVRSYEYAARARFEGL